jgi:hypothetical protein
MRARYLTPLALLTISACHSNESALTEFNQNASATIDARFDVVFESAVDTLREYGFRLNELDRNQGRITTFALVGRHWFEFWRRDAIAIQDVWESTVLLLRRRVTITITRSTDDQPAQMTVQAVKERSSTPDRQVTNSAALVHFLNPEFPDTQTGTEISKHQDRWIPMGRDQALEARILSDIQSKL